MATPGVHCDRPTAGAKAIGLRRCVSSSPGTHRSSRKSSLETNAQRNANTYILSNLLTRGHFYFAEDGDSSNLGNNILGKIQGRDWRFTESDIARSEERAAGE